MCSCILTEDYEFIVTSNMRNVRTKRMNNSYEIESHQIKGIPENDPIVHNMDKLADQGEYHSSVQVFHPHQDIINLKVQLVTESRNGKKLHKNSTTKERISEDDYCIEFSNGKHGVLEYKYLINILNKDGEDDIECWKFYIIKDHCWFKDKTSKWKTNVLISWDGYKEKIGNQWISLRNMIQ